MKRLTFVLVSVLLCAGTQQDQVTELVETMRQLAFAGDQRAIGRLVPTLILALAKPHPQSALAWNQIGAYHAVQGNPVEAEHAYLRGIGLLEQAGSDRGTLALLLLNLGQLYLETGDHARRTEKTLRRALDLAEQVYASDSEDLSNFVYVLGLAQNQSGNRNDASRQFERALLLTGHSRNGNVRRGAILGNLAVLRAKAKQWSEARDTSLQSLALLEQNLGTAHPILVPAYLNLAWIQQHFERWDLASTALERARGITESQLGSEHRYMIAILESSALVLRKTGRHAEARQQARRAKSLAASLPQVPVGASIPISELGRE
jgi:tetratricopeptide (TPR) repeat protein